MDRSFIVDFREFDKAIAEYAAVSGKDGATALHRSLNNLAIHGMKLQKEAEASAIQTLESKDWWPKLIAKLMRRRFVSKMAKRFAKAKTERGKSKASLKLARATTSGRGFYTRAQAAKFSQSIIKLRMKAVRFMKFFFASMSRAVAPHAKMSAAYSRKFAGFNVRFSAATKEKLSASCVVSYEYTKRTVKTALRTVRLLEATMAKAIPATIADMRGYMQDQMNKNARKFSAKGA